MAFGNLPASIRVGYRTYTVRTMSAPEMASRDVYGECDNARAEIRYWDGLEPVKIANTVLHELLHACWNVSGLVDDDKQERIIYTMANVLTQVWRDNPALVAWIGAQLNSEAD